MADRIVVNDAVSLLRDRKLPLVTKCTHSRVVDLILEGRPNHKIYTLPLYVITSRSYRLLKTVQFYSPPSMFLGCDTGDMNEASRHSSC